MATEITLKRLPGVLAKEFEGTRLNIARGLRDGARIGKVVVKRRTPKDRGMAQMGWQNHNGPMNARGQTPAAWLENSTPYIGILENGARPHPVSAEGRFALYQWIERHYRLSKSGALQQVVSLQTRQLAGDRLTNTRSKAFGYARAREVLSKHGAFTKKLIEQVHPEYSGRLIPEALNIVGAICHKLNTKGQKPLHFVKNSQPELVAIAQEQVEKHVREGAKGRRS